MRLVLAAVSVMLAQTQSTRTDEKQTAAVEAAVKTIEERAAPEISRLGAQHAWAGVYYAGDGTGMNVRLALAPAAGFAYGWHGCMGSYDRNYGTVEDNGRQLHLVPKLANAKDGIHLETELVPIAWGPRRYLIAAPKLKDFCNGVNAGREPRTQPHGLFLLRLDDEKKGVNGRPRSPAGALDCILDKPIRTRIVSVGASRTKLDDKYEALTTSVRLGAGRVDGVWEGMTFAYEALGPLSSIRVVEVSEHSSQAEIKDWGEKGTTKPPAVGVAVTTKR